MVVNVGSVTKVDHDDLCHKWESNGYKKPSRLPRDTDGEYDTRLSESILRLEDSPKGVFVVRYEDQRVLENQRA